jgi:hypothetical protein
MGNPRFQIKLNDIIGAGLYARTAAKGRLHLLFSAINGNCQSLFDHPDEQVTTG